MLFATFTLATLAASPQEATLPYDAAQVVLAANDPLVKRVLHLDGDGVPDAVGLQRDYGFGTTPHRTYVGVYYGDGTGDFERLHTLTISGPFPDYDNPVVKGDFDGDGDDDFATTAGNELHVFLCDGRNEPVAQPPVQMYSSGTVDLEARDLNGDGRDDLVAVSTSGLSHGIAVHLSPAVWSPGATANVATLGQEPGAMALFDVGGATYAGVTYATGPTQFEIGVRVFAVSSGAPVLATTHPLPGPLFASELLELAGGDVDGDGDEDLVAFGASEYYLLRSDGTSLTAEAGVAGGPATDLFDVDQDGDLDGVCCGGGGDSPPSLHTWGSAWEIALNDGTGTFAKAKAVIGVAGRRWAGADDVDGDGDLDLVAGRSVYFSRGAGFDLPGLVVGPGIHSGSLVDGDGDGDLDVNVALQSGVLPTYYENHGAGEYTFSTFPTTGFPAGWAAPYTAGVGDYDADGDPDTVIGFYLTPGVPSTYFVENVAGTYTYRATPTTDTLDPVGPTRKSLALDWNRDGHLDVVHTPAYITWPMGVAPTDVWHGDGAGDFTYGGELSDTWIVHLADFDGDGLEDFLVAHASGLGVRLADPLGGWGAFTLMPSPCRPEARVVVADLDEDGDLDVAAISIDRETPVFFLNDGSGAFVADLTAIPTQNKLVNSLDLGWIATDFDGDGREDLILWPGPSGLNAAHLYRNSAAGVLAFEHVATMALGSAYALDHDLDGDEDLVGGVVHRSVLEDAVSGGSASQHGTATPGSGGFVPRLGVGNATDVGAWAKFGMSGAKGGQLAVLAFGLVPAELVDFPAAGVTAYLDPAFATTLAFPMPGLPLDGEGELELPFFAPLGIAGLTFHHQLFVFDPGAVGGIAASRGLTVTYGMP